VSERPEIEEIEARWGGLIKHWQDYGWNMAPSEVSDVAALLEMLEEAWVV
tara:strand:+ start:259 stop:408 length:150 start_codon:yes stop_codon:yes gene_type:complete